MSRVALIGENSIEYIKKLINIWNDGNCAVLLDWRIPLTTSVDLMHEANVSKCFIGKKVLKLLKNELPDDIQFIVFDDECNEAMVLPSSIYDMFEAKYSSDEAIVIYSSGTTGKSKGIILSHFAINTNADAIIDYMHPTEKDCIYIAKTLAHSSTLTGELLVALKMHTQILIAPTIVPPRVILSNIDKNKVTLIGLNPTLLSIFADEVERSKVLPKTLHTIYVSGSILNDSLYEKSHKVLSNINIYNVYGLSEAGPRVTAQRDGCCKNNSVGKPIRGVELAIVDENGEIVPEFSRGMVHINTPSLFSGYISGHQKHTSVYKNWFNTGDIGFIDPKGELHIVGRQDDVVITDAHKIYPSEIEKQILKMPKIRDCAVVGVQKDEQWYLGCLYVGTVSKHEFLKHLSKILPTYEIPKIIVQNNEIPKNRNGKVDRYKVKEILL